jgi:hypothetical protein
MLQKHGGIMTENLILVLVLIGIILIALREFWTWFLKLNEISSQQKDLIKEQQETNRILKLWAKAEASTRKNGN